MGRLTGLQFSREEFTEALGDAIRDRVAPKATDKDIEAILGDIEDTIDGLPDIFEPEEKDDEDDETEEVE
jgi:hypothetical protein